MWNKILAPLAVIAALAAWVLPAPEAAAQPQGLDIGQVRLNLAFQPGPRTPGRLFIRGIIDDNDTEMLVADLLTNTATIRVQDSLDFDHMTVLDQCADTGNSVFCQSDSTGFRVKAFVKRWKNLPDVWRLNLRVRDLTELETGLGPLTPPVTVTLTHGSTTRTDIVAQVGGNEGDCKVKKEGTRLRCKSK